MNKERREPWVRIAKRGVVLPRWKAWGIRGIALVGALVLCAIIIYSIVELNPLKVYGAMFEGAFGTNRRMWVTIRDTMMLLCIGIGLAPAFKMRFWNIGAEGQILMGGIASAACMIYLGGDLPAGLLLPLMFILSALAGGLWGFIPAWFKAKWNTNETLFTLMMNYIAIQITSYFVALWENPPGSNSVGVINPQTKAGWFPEIFGQMYTLNVIIVLALAVLMFIYLNYSKQGYEIAVVGESRRTASYAGIKVDRVIIRTMALSGALCGLIGLLLTSSTDHTMTTTIVDGRGFTAVMVSWMAKFNPVIMIFVSLLLVVLSRGASEISTAFGLNRSFSDILTGIILFFIIGCEFFINYKVQFRSSGKKEA